MKLPLKLIIKSLSSSKFHICYFKDKNHDLNAPPHYHVLVPVKSDSYLLICVITTKFEKLSRYYKSVDKEDAVNSLVYIDSNDFSFITSSEGCVVNCNNAELLVRQDFLNRIDKSVGIKICAREKKFNNVLKKKIFKAIQNSPIVKNIIKKELLIDLKNINNHLHTSI